MKRLGAFVPLMALVLIASAAIVLLLRGGERADHFEPRLGRAAPSYALAALEGQSPLTPARFAGRPYLINLYASWCAPCRMEHPLLMRLAADGAPILGVAYKDRPEDARGFLAELGDPFVASGLDPDGAFGLELGVAGVPETFVIGADGRIAAVHRGPLTEAVVRSTILPALNQR